MENFLIDYQLSDIFNVDQMGLYYKYLFNKTLTFKDDDCHGGNNNKDRITVLVGAIMSGKEKLPIIGSRYNKP